MLKASPVLEDLVGPMVKEVRVVLSDFCSAPSAYHSKCAEVAEQI